MQGHNAKARRHNYTAAEIDGAIRAQIRADNIRDDSTFLQHVKWELWLSRLSPRAKLVGLAIWEHANKDGTGAFPSMRRLLVMVGGSKRDLALAIEEFTGWEFAEMVPGSGKRANEYRFHLTVMEFEEHLNSDNVVVPLRPSKPSSGTTTVPLRTEASVTTVVPQAPEPEVLVVPLSPVVVPSTPSSGTIAYISTRASDLIDLNDLKGEEPPSRLAKIAATMAAAITASVLPAAAQPPEPPAQIQQWPAECWQTPKARMDAGLNINELRAQKMVWMTETGLLQVAGAFREELATTFPLVDITNGLAIAAATVHINQGALMAMREIRKRFGYQQSDLAAKQKRSEAFRKPPENKQKPDGMPDYVWERLQADEAKAKAGKT